MAFVIDASLALAWCFPDEVTERSDALLERARRDDVLVPAHFPVEVANVLAQSERSGRLDAETADRFAEALRSLSLIVGDGVAVADVATIARVARAHELSAYDWLYLDLARARGAALATLDGRLAEAARHLNVEVL